jgi:hypothetical protein
MMSRYKTKLHFRKNPESFGLVDFYPLLRGGVGVPIKQMHRYLSFGTTGRSNAPLNKRLTSRSSEDSPRASMHNSTRATNLF